jgi:hypothetical protein
MSELIAEKLSSVRSKHSTVSIFTGLALAIALILVWTTLAMWIDWNVANGLPRWARILSLLLELAAVGAIVYTFIIRPITRAPDDEEVALMIEREWPDFNTRLIASVQLTQPQAVSPHSSALLVKAMVRQTEKLAEETQVTDVVKTRTLNRSLLAAAIICVLVIFLFLWAQPTSAALLQRAFLGNVALPTKTHLQSTTGDLNIALGDALKITTTVTGYQPAAGRIDLTFNSGRSQSLPLEKDPNAPGTYAITLDAIHESFQYSVHIYDAHSDTFQVTALERPEIANVEIVQIYPAYTGMGTVTRQPGDLALLAGSRLKLKVTSTRPLRVAPAGPGKANYVLRFVDEKQGGGGHSDTVPLVRSHTNLKEASIDAPDGMTLPNGLNALSIHLIDTDDLESKDTAVYPVEIIPDRPPTIRIFEPDRKEELVTAQAKLEIGYIAEDDILLGKVTLKYKQIATDSGEESAVQSIDLPLPPKTRSQKTTYLWDITQIPIPPGKPTLEGSILEYWLEAEDTNNLTGPGKATTEHYAIRVVTRAEKQAEMMARSSETISGIKSASEDQDNLAQSVREKINPTTNTHPATPTPENP